MLTSGMAKKANSIYWKNKTLCLRLSCLWDANSLTGRKATICSAPLKLCRLTVVAP